MDSSLSEEFTVEVMRNIYDSCDPESSDVVPVSKLIEFITPFMLESLSALDNLRHLLDPENSNPCIGRETFYEIMNEWTNKMKYSADEDSAFNKTPSALDIIDQKQLPLTQSTPRPSIEKLHMMSCGIPDLSNVSTYNMSISTQTNESCPAGPEKTILEEEIKSLGHQLSKLTNEMTLVRQQLAASEEQNEVLQTDLEQCKARLHSEQQIVVHLQIDKKYNDELREELNSARKQIEELRKKLVQFEKDNHHLLNDIKQSEEENAKLEEKCEELLKREQEAKKDIISIKTGLDLKDQEIISILKINEELQNKLGQQRDIIDQLTNENEFLEQQKGNIEKALHEYSSARRDSLIHQYKTSLADCTNLPNIDVSVPLDIHNYNTLSPTPIDTSPRPFKSAHLPTMSYTDERSNVVQDQGSEDEYDFKAQETESGNHSQGSLHDELSQVVGETFSFPYSYSLLSFEKNEGLVKLDEGNLSYVVELYKDEINQLKVENDSVQAKLEIANKDNDRLCEQISEMKDKMSVLQQELNDLMTKKNDKETLLEHIKEEKSIVETEVKKLAEAIRELTDQNNNLSEKEKSLNNRLELKSNIMADLEQNLLQLKKELVNLQTENIAKEKELSAKFNFEAAYKELQMELTERNEEIETLTETNEKLKKFLSNSTTSKQELELLLKQARTDLEDHENKSKRLTSLNENITLTATQVQVHLDRKNGMINELVELNKRFENNVARLEEDLQIKIAEVTKLRDTFEADVKIKSIMWRDNKELKSQLDAEVEKNKNLIQEIKEIGEKHEQEYSELLSNYNQEVEKSCELCDQIYTYKADLSSSINRYNEEVDKNRKLYEQVSALKKDIDQIRDGQDEYKGKINKKLTDYEDLINQLEKKLHEARLENDKLKTTISVQDKQKSTKMFELDVTLSENTKNTRTFEKQKLAIERLKEKLENMQDQLQYEKSRREVPEQLVKEKEEIKDKYTKTLLDFEQLRCSCLLEKQELQDTVADLSSKLKTCEQRYTQLENNLREVEEALSLKLSQAKQQNQHLYTELRNKEFVIKNAYLEIETYKNLFKNADQKAQELSKTMSVYLFESNNKEKEIQYFGTQLSERDSKILLLSSKINDQDAQLQSILTELTEMKNINMNLEKENMSLQEMLSKSDDHKEKELLDIEEKLKSTRRLLQCNEMELNLIEKKVSNSTQDYDKMSNEIVTYETIINNGKSELSRASNLVLNKWNDILERETIYKELIALNASDPSENESAVCTLSNKIKIAVLLLELLASLSPASMEGTDYGINSLLSDKINSNQYSQSPPRLQVSRPVSPDSPSVDIEETNSDTLQEINFNTSKEIYISPNNPICKTTDNSYETAGDEFSFTKDQTLEFTSFQDTFPNISDTFLEKLGLNEGSLKQNLSKKETEEVFATFAIQIALDSRDIKERLEKQKDRCIEQHEKFLTQVRDISNRLRDHKCIGASDPISPVFVLLEDLKILLRDLTRSTERFGILYCENRMMKCWNLVTNYMALLKQDATSLHVLQSEEKSDEPVGMIASFGAKFRKRLGHFNNKDELNSSSSVLASGDAGSGRKRYTCRAARKSFVLLILMMLSILVLFIFIHWQCRMTAHENQVCILDDFIKKIQIGNPPY